MCSNVIIKTPERRHWRRFDVFVVNFGQVNADWEVMLRISLNMPLISGALCL